MTRSIGDRVAIIPHRNTKTDGTVVDEVVTVTNPHDPTDMVRIDGTPVGHYVRVRGEGWPAYRPDEGYHEVSLEVAT